MAEKLRVLDPRGFAPKVEGKRLAARPESLEGKTLYLIDCLFDNADVFMEQLRLWFAANMPGVTTKLIRPRESWVDDPDMRKRVVEDGDVAIIGVGL